MIAFRNVTKTYVTKTGEVQALRGITAELPERGIVCIVGKSGCGKSTLLNLLGGLDSPTSGEILLNGEAAKEADLLPSVSYVFQDFGLFPFLTAEENVLVAGCRKEEAAECMERVGLGEFAKRQTRTLSGGEQQRLAIARALAKRPEIILADEPTGNLDEENAEIVFRTFREIAKDKLVVVVTHDSESAERYADRLISLRDGEIAEVRGSEKTYSVTREPAAPVRRSEVDRKESFRRSAKFSFALLRRAKARSAVFGVLFIALLTLLCALQSILYANVFRLICWHIEDNDIAYVKFVCEIETVYGRQKMPIDVGLINYLNENTNCVYTDFTRGGDAYQAIAIGVCHGGLPKSIRVVAGTDEGGVLIPYGDSALKNEGLLNVGDSYSVFDTEIPIVGIYDDEALTLAEQGTLPRVLVREEDYPVRLQKETRACSVVVGIGKNYREVLRRAMLDVYHCRLDDIGSIEGYHGPVDMTDEINRVGKDLEALHLIGYVAAAILGGLVVAYSIYFVWFSVSESKREIGILRAFGVKYGEIIRIFLLQVCFLILPAIAVSFGATGIVLWALNRAVSPLVAFSYLRFNGFYAIGCFGTIAVCLLSALIPLIRLRKASLNPMLRNR